MAYKPSFKVKIIFVYVNIVYYLFVICYVNIRIKYSFEKK